MSNKSDYQWVVHSLYISTHIVIIVYKMWGKHGYFIDFKAVELLSRLQGDLDSRDSSARDSQIFTGTQPPQPLVIRFISVISNHLAHGFPRLVLHPGSTLVELFFSVHVNEKTGAGLPHLDHSVARHLLWEMLHIDERSDALSKLGRDLDHLGGIGCSDFSCGWRHLIENITSLGPRTGWFGASWKPGHL